MKNSILQSMLFSWGDMMELFFIPQPQRCILLNGVSEIGCNTPVVVCMPQLDKRLVKLVKTLFNNVRIEEGPFALYSENSFIPECPQSHSEGYMLNIRKKTLQLVAGDAPGLFYGLQTLRQYFEMPEHPSIEINDWPDLSMRSDYLDMRGLFPKFENLLKYVEEMARYKLNTLIIEYEDKLPRKQKEFCHPSDSLSYEQHTLLIKTAYENFINVIPLQQSFGHLEYVLKLPQYRHLRELPGTPGEICPLRDGAFELVSKLIEETVHMHPSSQYIHLGCDEVWSLGQSVECQSSGKSRRCIAIEFINRLAEKVLSMGKIPIVWHDMLIRSEQSAGTAEFDDYKELSLLNKNIIVAVWLYSPDYVNTVAPYLMETLHSYGIKTIPCCSVRASDHCNVQNYPCIEQRLRNIDTWCEFIEKSRCNGMINTNWYSSFSFGNPYGLFETSRYTAFYAAERCWNLRSNNETFLERFMGTYHGAYAITLTTGKERRYDYYKLISKYRPFVTRNKDTAWLIDVMYRQEYATNINYSIFRARVSPNNSVELDCLRERALQQYSDLRIIEKELKEILSKLLTNTMATIFFESRSYSNKLYQKDLEDILGEPLP